MSFACYVYYRVLPERQADASRAARQLIEDMRGLDGVSARLMTKVAEPLLWMEVYEGIADQSAFLQALAECCTRSGLERWLGQDGNRHVEMFQCA